MKSIPAKFNSPAATMTVNVGQTMSNADFKQTSDYNPRYDQGRNDRGSNYRGRDRGSDCGSRGGSRGESRGGSRGGSRGHRGPDRGGHHNANNERPKSSRDYQPSNRGNRGPRGGHHNSDDRPKSSRDQNSRQNDRPTSGRPQSRGSNRGRGSGRPRGSGRGGRGRGDHFLAR